MLKFILASIVFISFSISYAEETRTPPTDGTENYPKLYKEKVIELADTRKELASATKKRDRLFEKRIRKSGANQQEKRDAIQQDINDLNKKIKDLGVKIKTLEADKIKIFKVCPHCPDPFRIKTTGPVVRQIPGWVSEHTTKEKAPGEPAAPANDDWATSKSVKEQAAEKGN